MDKRRNLAGECLLRMTFLVVALVEFHNGFYLCVGKEGEELKVVFDALVARIEPELVKSVWRRLFGIEPDSIALAFAEFFAARFIGDDGNGECIGGFVLLAADELHAGDEGAGDRPHAGEQNAELAAIQIGGNVTYKPGVKMIKINSDPKTYAIGEGGALRWVSTESAAIALYGSDWNKKIDDVPDAFFSNYSRGEDIEVASDFNPANETASATTINHDKELQSAALILILLEAR